MHQQYVEIQGSSGILRGTAYLPETGEPRPVAVLCHGFGGTRWEGGLLPDIGRALAEKGVAALAVDRTGQGESDGSFFDVTVQRDVDDVEHILDYARSLKEMDPQDVHLMGISLGAVVATIVAALRPDQVRSLSLMSTACSFADEIRGGKLQGMPLSIIDEQGYLDFYGHRLGPAIVEASKDIDPFEAARGFQGPVRLLHGEKDFIPVEYVRRYLDVYGDQADLTVSPTADHGWTNVSDRDLVESEIVNFIARHARGVQ